MYNTSNLTIFQFCFLKNISLPCFCYHEKLSIAGNCRMCLVQVNNTLVVSCAVAIAEGMQIYTDNKRVRVARENILEFILSNHPLDCPICDQAGECDLQDISKKFGGDRGRFNLKNKRAVENLNSCGPLIKTIMTRCIHCTRCVRFTTEVCGDYSLGVLGRGLMMEIGTYIEKSIETELSGNVIDLCPVGALTSMPYAFAVRFWELTTVYSIDVLDALASSVRFDIANNSVVRVVPMQDENVNEEWITNKARFSYDSLNTQRLIYPKIKINSKLMIIGWEKALNIIISLLNNVFFEILECLVGNFIDLESALSLKLFLNSFGCTNLNFLRNFYYNYDFKFLFLLNLTLVLLEDFDFGILVGTNLRLESPLINSRLIKNNARKISGLLLYSFGFSQNSFVKIQKNSFLGYKLFLDGKVLFLRDIFFINYKALIYLGYTFSIYNKPLFFFGMSTVTGFMGWTIVVSTLNLLSRNLLTNIFYSWKLINVVVTYLGILSYFELGLGIYNEKLFSTKGLLYVIDVDFALNNSCYTIYQGAFSNSSNTFAIANLVLPTANYVEKVLVYMNLEGRYRFTKKAVIPSKLAYADYEIIQSLHVLKNLRLSHNFAIVPWFTKIMDYLSTIILYSDLLNSHRFNYNLSLITGFDKNLRYDFDISLVVVSYIYLFRNILYFKKMQNTIFTKVIHNYYNTDIFCKNSKALSLSASKMKLNNFCIGL